jgi:hypothetical protein
VQDVLRNKAATAVRVLAVWEPILLTDLAPPISSVLGRLSDRRVRQFWDRDHLLSAQMKKDTRPPQPGQDCCERKGHLWDLAAVYPAGTTWTDRLPTATIFNGPVIDLIDPLTAALAPPNR